MLNPEPTSGKPPNQILAEGDGWVAIQKPSGVAVHRSQLVRDRVVILQTLRNQLGQHVYPVHRLDRATSGVLFFGLNSETTRIIKDALTADHAIKRYLALCRGTVEPGRATVVNTPIKQDNGLKQAETAVQCIASSKEPRCSLLLAEPKTGRTHQVRRHVRDLCHPVLGDSSHGDTRVNRVWREHHGLQRLALHCWSIRLNLPTGPLIVRSPIPEDLLSVWTGLPFWSEAQSTLETLDAALG